MNKFTEEGKLAFIKVYLQDYAHIKISEAVDLHQQFADELMMDRQDAKRLCHIINYYCNMRVF